MIPLKFYKVYCHNALVKRSSGSKHDEIKYPLVTDKIKEAHTFIEHISNRSYEAEKKKERRENVTSPFIVGNTAKRN